MAITVKSLRDWLSTLNSEAAVAIDDGGLCLQDPPPQPPPPHPQPPALPLRQHLDSALLSIDADIANGENALRVLREQRALVVAAQDAD